METEVKDTGRIIELKTALTDRTTKLDEAMKAVKVEGANVTVSSELAGSIKSLMADAQEIKGLIETERFVSDTNKWMTEPVGRKSVALEAEAQKPMLTSLGKAFLASDEFKALKASGGVNMAMPFEIQVGDITGYGQKDVYGANIDGAPSYARQMGSIQFDPIVPRGYRPTRVRDLFPVANTSANLIDFFRVMGFVTDGTVAGGGLAAGVSDRTGDASTGTFTPKAQSKLHFQSVQAPVRTIAHWEAAHRNVLDDLPQLQSIIDNELLYGLRLQEDDQILNGAGGDDLAGLLLTAGLQTYTQSVDEPNSDALRRSATKAVLANYPATGFVLHPNNWQDTELQRGADGQYMLVSNVTIGADTRIWRLPVVETPAIAEGTFLAGAFGLGAQVYDRQVANVRIAEQHADFFVRNAIVVLAEQRLALAVKRPEAFVKGTFN